MENISSVKHVDVYTVNLHLKTGFLRYGYLFTEPSIL